MKKIALALMVLAMILTVGLPMLQAQDTNPAPQGTPQCPYMGKTPPCGAMGMGMGRGMGYHGGRGPRGMGRGMNPNCPYRNTTVNQGTGTQATPPATAQ